MTLREVYQQDDTIFQNKIKVSKNLRWDPVFASSQFVKLIILFILAASVKKIFSYTNNQS